MGAPASALSRPRPGPVACDAGARFMKSNGIDYIYVDRAHPNTLVPDAIPVATDGETQVLRLP